MERWARRRTVRLLQLELRLATEAPLRHEVAEGQAVVELERPLADAGADDEAADHDGVRDKERVGGPKGHDQRRVDEDGQGLEQHQDAPTDGQHQVRRGHKAVDGQQHA
eukprot:7601396-Lingulodinium_polyedra.AAC.1